MKMDQAAQISPPIASNLLRTRSDYPAIRDKALQSLYSLGLNDIASLVLQWENEADELYSPRQESEERRRIRIYVRIVQVLIPVSSLKLGREFRLKHHRELQDIHELRLFVEFSASILHNENKVQSSKIVLPTEPIKIVADCYLCCNLMIAPGRVFATEATKYTWVRTTSKLDANAHWTQVVREMRKNGHPLIEIDYINPSENIDVPTWFNLSSSAARSLLKNIDHCTNSKTELSLNHLGSVFAAAIAYSGTVADLARFIGGEYHDGLDLLEHEIRDRGRELAKLFLSLFPSHSKEFLHRMIVKRTVSKKILGHHATIPCPPSVFARTDINFDVLAKVLPYLLNDRGFEALLNLAPGDEYEAAPHARSRISTEDLGTIVRWKRSVLQSTPVLDILYPEEHSHHIDSRTITTQAHTIMLIPQGESISIAEAEVFQKIAKKLGNRWEALYAEYQPGDYKDKTKRFATIRANQEKIGRLILERIRGPRIPCDEAETHKIEKTTISEIMDVVDYLNDTFLRPNKNSNSQSVVKFASYSALKKSSDRWHIDLYRSSFKDPDVTYFPNPQEIDSDKLSAKLINTRRELHVTGSIFKNCLYSKHQGILDGKLYILEGKLKTKKLEFVCSIEFNGQDTFEIIEMKGRFNSLIEIEDQHVIKELLIESDLQKPKSSSDDQVTSKPEDFLIEELELDLIEEDVDLPMYPDRPAPCFIPIDRGPGFAGHSVDPLKDQSSKI